jgi:hypothetical protein
MTRLHRIAEVIAVTTDRRRLRILNRAWWKEFFRLQQQWKKAA